MLVRELMREEVICFEESTPLGDVLDRLVESRLHGAPVVDGEGRVSGVISQQDVFFSGMTLDRDGETVALTAGEVMTSPPVIAAPDTTVVELCKMMFELRLHRVPIVEGDEVIGIVSSLDVCNAVAQGADLK